MLKDQVTDWISYSEYEWYRVTKSEDKKWDRILCATLKKNDNKYTGTIYQPRAREGLVFKDPIRVCTIHSEDFEILKLKINIKLSELGFDLNL